MTDSRPDTLRTDGLAAVDGIANFSPAPVAAADSLAVGPHIFGLPFPEILPTPRADTCAATQGSPAAVFGPGSGLHAARATRVVSAREDPFSSAPAYRCSVLALGIAYCLVIYYYRNSVIELVKMLRGKLSVTALLDQADHAFTTLLGCATAMSLLMGSIVLVRLAGTLTPPSLAVMLPAWVVESAVPIVFAALATGLAFRCLLLRAAGGLTFSRGFTDRVWEVRRMSTALGTLAVAPPVLLLALWQRGTEIAVPALLLALLAAMVVLAQYRINVLFRMQKVSFLQWILYLCAAELFPVSFAAAILYRGIG
jgi:hypothetical protein